MGCGEEFGYCIEAWAIPSNTHGGIHDMNIKYSRINAMMHCVYVAGLIGTLFVFIGKVDCIMKSLMC
jgi:hypothetical protein